MLCMKKLSRFRLQSFCYNAKLSVRLPPCLFTRTEFYTKFSQPSFSQSPLWHMVAAPYHSCHTYHSWITNQNSVYSVCKCVCLVYLRVFLSVYTLPIKCGYPLLSFDIFERLVLLECTSCLWLVFYLLIKTKCNYYYQPDIKIMIITTNSCYIFSLGTHEFPFKGCGLL